MNEQDKKTLTQLLQAGVPTNPRRVTPPATTDASHEKVPSWELAMSQAFKSANVLGRSAEAAKVWVEIAREVRRKEEADAAEYHRIRGFLTKEFVSRMTEAASKPVSDLDLDDV